MKRKTKQFMAYHNQLMQELDKNVELFLKQRPFLESPGEYEPIINGLLDSEIEEKITNEYTIEILIKKLFERR